MKYIGPFFRMNSLSQNEISSQLFFLSREAIKTIVLNSKCGIVSTTRSSKKSSANDTTNANNFSPLLCIYKKSSPTFVHSKSSQGFDESTFKREIIPSTNALMTLTILELSDYYKNYIGIGRTDNILSETYISLAKEQLEFYYSQLRNSEGVFVPKKNITEGSSKNFVLVEKERKFNFVDQAFMMNAYYLYSIYNTKDDCSKDYESFALEILQMFVDFKDSLYNLSFDDLCKLLLSFNVFYKHSQNETCKLFIIDLTDCTINKFNERDYYSDNLEYCSLLSICLLESYKHTEVISFKEKHSEIVEKLLSLYDEDKGVFFKLKDKKEIKYSSLDINFYILSLMIHCKEISKDSELSGRLSTLYRRLMVSSNIVPSWPDAPTIDEMDRYRDCSLKADDLMDETYYRMPNLPTPSSSGVSSVFVKNVVYSRKKDTFTTNNSTFESNSNMLIFFSLIHFLKDDVSKLMFINTSQLAQKRECSNLNNLESDLLSVYSSDSNENSILNTVDDIKVILPD